MGHDKKRPDDDAVHVYHRYFPRTDLEPRETAVPERGKAYSRDQTRSSYEGLTTIYRAGISQIVVIPSRFAKPL